MSKCFSGFEGFTCQENIWRGIFGTNKYGGSKQLRSMLSIDVAVSLDDAIFSRKLKGDNAWSSEVETFLKYSENPETYQQKWLDKWASPPGCLDKFRRFIVSVPVEATNSEQARFLPAARKVSAYLEQILQLCSEYPNDSDEWIAAGVYVLVAFFLQNGKSVVPQCYYPPRECDPVKMQDAGATVVPDMGMQTQEESEYRFNLLEHIYQIFKDTFGCGTNAQSDEEFSLDITPAEVRRKWKWFSGNFSLIDKDGYNSRVYAVEKFLITEKGRWYPMLRLRALPYTEEINNGDITRNFRHEAGYFTDNAECNGILLTARKDKRSGLIYSYLFKNIQTEDSDLYISQTSGEINVLYIDENGFPRDTDLELLLADFGFKSASPHMDIQPLRWRKTSSKFKPDYLRYLILDMQTMQEVPKYFSRDPSTGEYWIHVSIPCPGVLGVLEVVSCEDVNGDQLAVSGYQHGIYGLKKNPKAAERLMEEGTKKGNPQMAFEYGTLLRLKGKITEAETHLRFAAQNVPGAQFELANLLKERGTPSDLIEAAQLIDDLWQAGYRTYGKRSIKSFE